ncbi:MAG: UDP-3-O-(3-hydroxymyristoyl)glucosamine N-acyltransferase [Gammaproteobacteria bacterium]|nr:UDP-3-O-(3-hydroxymyristoyl)glucosamine N-acyltransferase [Gammaproteobacteria bacterium]
MITLSELASILGCTVVGDGALQVRGGASLVSAGPGDIVFITSEKYLGLLGECSAGAVLVSPEHASGVVGNKLICDNPHVAFARALEVLYPRSAPLKTIHESAVIAETASLGEAVTVGPNSCVGEFTMVGDDVWIGANVTIGDNVRIGAGTRLEPGVVVLDGCHLGRNCIIHAGAVIGADGFGYARNGKSWVKVPQIGVVRLGDEVEIGANTTIDRGALDDTIIGNRVKIDNQVQIAHNVTIGEDTMIAGCVGIAGSATIGANCAIGGQAGILGHLSVVDGVTIGACSLVSKSITKPGMYSSSIRVQELAKWQKTLANLNRLDQFAGKITALEQRMNTLEGEA